MKFPLRLWLVALLLVGGLGTARADEFDTLRLKWRDMLTGGTNQDLGDSYVQGQLNSVASTANSYWNSLNTAPARTYLWSDAARTNVSADISTCYSRLRTMALAWATRGCSLQGDTNLASDIIGGLDWMYANRYNETVTNKYDNWWDWEIGSPQNLNNAAVLMYDALSAVQITNYNNAVDRFTPAATYTGANRTDTALAVGIRGILGKNSSKLANASSGLSPVFPYVTSSDGFYRDGSFIQHTKFAYTGSYGSVLIDGLSRQLWLYAGSTWDVTDTNRANVYRWVYDSYQPVIYKGATMDDLRGRAISRVGSQDHSAGAGNMNSILLIAQFAPTNDAAAFKSMLKYWIQADTYRIYTNSVPLTWLPWVRQLMADTNIQPRGELLGHYQFPCMDRVVHLRPGWGFALSMSSSRIYNYESINSENLHGWFTGDGMTYLYNADLGQFSSDFWPTVDPYHLPGTTVDLTTRANASGEAKVTTQNWVGGAVLSNGFGAVGMSLAAYSSTLVAKKSWFLFDDEVVCLGAGITCSGSTNIHTTIENRRLGSNPTNTFTADGSVMPATVGWSSNLTSASWCALANAGGYYFPGGANLQAVREARTNAWWDINQGSLPTSSNTNPMTDYYLKLWCDHGVKPTNATYAYVLLPNFSASDIAAYAANPDIIVLTNSSAVQAVRESTLGIVAANFWADGTNSADFITVNKRCSVLTRESANALEVAVSDPTQTNTASITVTLDRAGTSVLAADAGVTVLQLSPQIKFSAVVNGARGQTFHATFNTDLENPNPTWDANPGLTGAQDGSGTWDNVASNWWNNVTNLAWNDATPPTAIFGAGGAAGTVTVAGAHTADSLLFQPVASGSYLLAGSGPLTLNAGLTADESAALTVPLILASNQTWTVAGSNTLSVAGAISAASPASLSLAGAGTLSLSGNNQFSSNMVGLIFTDATLLEVGATTQTVAQLTLDDGVATSVGGAGGQLIINGTSDLRLGGTAAGQSQGLDLSGLQNFIFSNSTGLFRVSGQISGVSGATASGALTLAQTNFITAATLGVGDGARNVSASAWNTGALRLGGCNSVRADSIQIGGNQVLGTVSFATNLPPNPVLVIRGSAGGASRAAVALGASQSSNYEPTQGTLDLVSGVNGACQLDALVGTLTLGQVNYGGGTPAFGTLSMGGGTLDATNIVIARRFSSSTGSGSVTGSLTNNGGTLKVQTLTLGSCETNAGSAVTATLVLQGGATLKAQTVQPGASLGTGAMKRNFYWNDGTIANYDASTDLAIASGLTLWLTNTGAHTFSIDAGRAGTIDAVLTGSGGLIKSGPGSLSLTASNTISGNTSVNAGALTLTGSGSLNASPLLTLANGAVLDVTGVSGSFAVGPLQTLAGSGAVRGNVRINGKLAPGGPIGTLSFSNNLVLAGTMMMELTRDGGAATNDQAVVLGGLTYGGSLVLTNIGTNALRWGDTFALFKAAAPAGSFTNIVWPPLTLPLYWTNRLAQSGIVAVATTTDTTPTNLIWQVLGGTNLVFSWPASHIGWRLETQTNTIATGLSTNWHTVAGSATTNQAALLVDPNQGAGFFRLVYP